MIKIATIWLAYCIAVVQGMSILDRREAIQTVLSRTQTIVGSMLLTANDKKDDASILERSSLKIPRVGYSLYKTPVDQAAQCTLLALEAGVRHLDVASLYGSNAQVGRVIREYLTSQGLANDTASSKRQRRTQLFVHHKVSNDQQSSNRRSVKRAVKQELHKLGLQYLDLCSLHSPLTNHRLTSYQALQELKEEGLIKSVGVCNFGVQPLQELVDANMPPPAMVQLVLSPFNQHKDVIQWAKDHDSVIGCNAWSKLSSVDGPQDGWAVLADIAKAKSMTKAQVLVRWALQHDYVSVPRSACKSKIERLAIQENSYNGIKGFVLTDAEMRTLDSLDEQLPAGRLGIIDGWTEADIVDRKWDPTLVV
jgi:2,5-diketo-D-gluconate reductase A